LGQATGTDVAPTISLRDPRTPSSAPATRVSLLAYQARFARVVYPRETVVASIWDEGSEVHLESEVKERPGAVVFINAVLTP
jgi:hypothetical protein